MVFQYHHSIKYYNSIKYNRCSWLVLKVDNMIVNILLGLILADVILITFMVFVIGKIIDERIK